MNIKELRMYMMKSKKTNMERSKALSAILNEALLMAKADGNREPNEKDIVAAAKRELKMAKQSEEAGAPFNPLIFEVCEEFLPKTMDENETRKAINLIIDTLPEKSMKMMGKVMGQLKTTYKDSVDGGLASKIVKEMLAQ